MEIDPWASKGIKNYDEICDKFGLEKIDSTKLPNPTFTHYLFRYKQHDLENPWS